MSVLESTKGNRKIQPQQLIPVFSERIVTHNETLADNAVLKIELPKSKMIQQIQIRLKLDYTTSASAVTYNEDEILEAIRKIRVLGNGGDPIRTTTAKIQYFREQLKKGTAPEKDTLGTSTSTNYVDYLTLTLHFQRDWNNPNDITSLLPARRFDELDLEITLGDQDDIASANPPTLNWSSSEVAIEVTEVSGAGIFNARFADIRETYKEPTISAQTQTFDTDDIQENILPVNAQILEQTIIAIDNGIRDDDIITDLMVKRHSPITEEMIKRKFQRIQAENKTVFKQESAVTGLLHLDYRHKFGRSLDRKNKINGLEPKAGDVKLHFLTGSPTGTSKYFLHTVWVA